MPGTLLRTVPDNAGRPKDARKISPWTPRYTSIRRCGAIRSEKWPLDAKEPRGWLDVTLQKTGATVVINALDRKHAKHAKHAKHGERHELKWRV